MKHKDLKTKTRERPWHELDATNIALGRLATQASILLRGKQDVNFKAHLDTGGHVVITNLDKVRITGNKLKDKFYYSHSGYLGNLKSKPLSELGVVKGLEKAVYGMLPVNKLRDHWIKRLHIYLDDNHPHKANLAGSPR